MGTLGVNPFKYNVTMVVVVVALADPLLGHRWVPINSVASSLTLGQRQPGSFSSGCTTNEAFLGVETAYDAATLLRYTSHA